MPNATTDLPEGCAVASGRTASETPADDGAAVVRAYLEAMEARDLERARRFLGPSFAMTFPGDVRLHSLEALIAWAQPRYRFVRKTCERFDAMGPVVYCFGTLGGLWPDGTPFQGIRFIDRFELAGGLIVRQDVWNDLAEVRSR